EPGCRVLEIEYFAARIAHRIIVPRREAVEVAVLAPRVSAAALRHAESGVRVRDDVGPWRRRYRRAGNGDLVVAAISEVPEAVSRHVGVRRRHVSQLDSRRTRRPRRGAHGTIFRLSPNWKGRFVGGGGLHDRAEADPVTI